MTKGSPFSQANMEEIKKWDIWIAEVLLEDEPTKSKIRPVLILGDDDVVCIDVAKITSHAKRDLFDLEIKDYIECGLNKESTIRLNSKIKLRKDKLHNRIGRLTNKNIIQARIILNRRK